MNRPIVLPVSNQFAHRRRYVCLLGGGNVDKADPQSVVLIGCRKHFEQALGDNARQGERESYVICVINISNYGRKSPKVMKARVDYQAIY